MGDPSVLRDNPRVDRVRWMATGGAPAPSQNPAYRPTHRHHQHRSIESGADLRVCATVTTDQYRRLRSVSDPAESRLSHETDIRCGESTIPQASAAFDDVIHA